MRGVFDAAGWRVIYDDKKSARIYESFPFSPFHFCRGSTNVFFLLFFFLFSFFFFTLGQFHLNHPVAADLVVTMLNDRFLSFRDAAGTGHGLNFGTPAGE